MQIPTQEVWRAAAICKNNPSLRHDGKTGPCNSFPSGHTFGILIANYHFLRHILFSFTVSLVTTAGMSEHLKCAARDTSPWKVKAVKMSISH